MFNQNSGNRRHKNQAEATIQLVGEEPFDGAVFLSVGDRLIDLLNDDRAFIPVRREDGETIIVAKSQIVSIIEVASEAAPEETREDAGESVDETCPEEDHVETEEAPAAENAPRGSRSFDPYAFLKISPTASVDEIRSAYKTRIKAVHPDSIASLGLDDELAAAALKATQKLNYAYRKIMRERENAPDAEERESA